jgi:hypothetical protein
MAYGSYPDAFDGSVRRSLREQICERVPQGEEFCPRRYFYLGGWQRNSVYYISTAERRNGMLCFVKLYKLTGLTVVGLLQGKATFVE